MKPGSETSSREKVFFLTQLPEDGKWIFFPMGIVVVFAGIAIFNLCLGVGVIPSAIWLLICVLIIQAGIRDARGVRNYLKRLLGNLFGRHFARIHSKEHPGEGIQFGFYIERFCFVERTVAPEDIEYVEWSAGQGSGMSGRDMDDWFVFARLNKSKYQGLSDFQLLGTRMKKSKAEQTGLAFIDFLKGASIVLFRQSEKKFSRPAHDDQDKPPVDAGAD